MTMSNTPQTELITFIKRIPSVKGNVSSGYYDEGFWWIKFAIDIDDPYAWHTVQELACVVNYLSIEDRLPTRFYPVSPAPYLNGGPKNFLSWIIENTDQEFTSDNMKEWLEGRLPNPVDDLTQWKVD
ncbi:hypothetical protein GCM10011418_16400 [Sphingobacterium alkalisoli]|nr:hypothetical protein GCM10011418_16400 [Sphingobacterium alkalisoli]